MQLIEDFSSISLGVLSGQANQDLLLMTKEGCDGQITRVHS